jgi:hypothetical protein
MPVRTGWKFSKKTGEFSLAPFVSAWRTAKPSMAALSKPGKLTGERISCETILPAAFALEMDSVRSNGKQRSRSISFAAAAPRKRLNMQELCLPSPG